MIWSTASQTSFYLRHRLPKQNSKLTLKAILRNNTGKMFRQECIKKELKLLLLTTRILIIKELNFLFLYLICHFNNYLLSCGKNV